MSQKWLLVVDDCKYNKVIFYNWVFDRQTVTVYSSSDGVFWNEKSSNSNLKSYRSNNKFSSHINQSLSFISTNMLRRGSS